MKQIDTFDNKLTAAKCPAVIDRPMANGAEPLMSLRRSSQTPCTTNTKINVIKAEKKIYGKHHLESHFHFNILTTDDKPSMRTP